jgi:hypothetical protein
MAKQEKRFRKTKEYSGRGRNRVIEHRYEEKEQSGKHDLVVVHQFGPGGEFPNTLILFSDTWRDDPPIPVSEGGLHFLRDVLDDVITTMQRNKAKRTRTPRCRSHT